MWWEFSVVVFYGLELKCPSKVHVLKALSQAHSTIGRGWNFQEVKPIEREFKSLGVCPGRGLVAPVFALSFLHPVMRWTAWLCAVDKMCLFCHRLKSNWSCQPSTGTPDFWVKINLLLFMSWLSVVFSCSNRKMISLLADKEFLYYTQVHIMCV
jgi:hypothetical protein